MLTCRRRLGLPWYPVRPRRTIPDRLIRDVFTARPCPQRRKRRAVLRKHPGWQAKWCANAILFLGHTECALFSLLAAGSPILETRSVLMLRQHEGKTFLRTGIVARGKCKMDKGTTFH